MPTGYTADIAKGISFETFALSCARNFGALILMRDDPMDAPIPDEFKPSDYNEKRLADASARITELLGMSQEECAKAARKSFNAEIDRHRRAVDESRELRARYDAMLTQARAYRSPSKDHDEFKKFMVAQIEESIRFDCSDDYYEGEAAKLVLLSGEEWRKRELDLCRRDIAYHTGEHQKELARTADRNRWVKQLRDSLK